MSVDDNVLTDHAGEEPPRLPDSKTLRAHVRDKYREVATDPDGSYHFHTGRRLAARLGYDTAIVDALPDVAVESFAGVANPFSLRHLEIGERVVDVGSGAGFDSFVAANHVGRDGSVVGVDMTPEMLDKSRATASMLGLDNVEFREGFAESLPVDDELGRRRDLQRCDQPVCRQGGSVRRDPTRPATRRVVAVRRHRQRPPGSRRGAGRHRLVDGLNRRRAAPCGLADNPSGRRVRRCRHRRRGRHVRRRRGRAQRPRV